jgi:hypothetical protein
MTVDGRPLTAVLDTGVSYSVLAERYVTAHHLPVRSGGEAQAVGGAVALGWTDTGTLAIGGLTRTGGGLSVATLPATATGGVKAVDLLIGRDLTGSAALDIDFVNHRFRLIPSGRLPFTGATAPLSLAPQSRVYVSELELGARTLRPVIVDTGDGATVTVSEAGWRASGIAAPTTSAVAYGLAGPIVTTVAVVPIMHVGDLLARNVEVRVEPSGGFSDAIGTAGRIGTGFLQRYRVLLDPAAGHLVFSPGPTADEPPLRSTSGLLLGLAKDRLRVLHVMRNGPAEAGGWHAGEEICSIDGQPIRPDYASTPLAGWAIGAPGRTVALRLCNGSTRSLTLRAFY